MAKVFIEKDIYVKDKYGVRRRAFLANHEVDEYFYNQIVSNEEVVNPDDLPKAPVKDDSKRSVHSRPVEAPAEVEVLTSEDGGAVERKRVDEAEGNAIAVEATASVAEGEPTAAEAPVPEEVVAEDGEAESEDKPKAKKSKKGSK